MRNVTLEHLADFLEAVEIEQTIDAGHVAIHIVNAGTSESPCRYVIVNDCFGNTTITP
jgi:hypothetical protein